MDLFFDQMTLRNPLTPHQQAEALKAAEIAVDCYAQALNDPKVVISTPLHGALFRLKQCLEGKTT